MDGAEPRPVTLLATPVVALLLAHRGIDLAWSSLSFAEQTRAERAARALGFTYVSNPNLTAAGARAACHVENLVNAGAEPFYSGELDWTEGPWGA
jgi:hypothetical protein